MKPEKSYFATQAALSLTPEPWRSKGLIQSYDLAPCPAYAEELADVGAIGLAWGSELHRGCGRNRIGGGAAAAASGGDPFILQPSSPGICSEALPSSGVQEGHFS